MFSLIGSIFKYSLLTLTILVLSHIIEIQGVTISQHVLRGMHFISGFSPQNQTIAIKEDFIKSINKRTQDFNKIDSEVSPDDQKALNQVIQRAQHKK